MIGTENVNLTVTTGKYEIRVSLGSFCVWESERERERLEAACTLWCHQQGHVEGTTRFPSAPAVAPPPRWPDPCGAANEGRVCVSASTGAPVCVCVYLHFQESTRRGDLNLHDCLRVKCDMVTACVCGYASTNLDTLTNTHTQAHALDDLH